MKPNGHLLYLNGYSLRGVDMPRKMFLFPSAEMHSNESSFLRYRPFASSRDIQVIQRSFFNTQEQRVLMITTMLVAGNGCCSKDSECDRCDTFFSASIPFHRSLDLLPVRIEFAATRDPAHTEWCLGPQWSPYTGNPKDIVPSLICSVGLPEDVFLIPSGGRREKLTRAATKCEPLSPMSSTRNA